MVEIHIYGKLRNYVVDPKCGRICVVTMEPCFDETVDSLLAQVGIPVEEVNHIFVNSELLASRSKAASFMGYPQARSSLFDWDLKIAIGNGDRIGLFGTDMALLGM